VATKLCTESAFLLTDHFCNLGMLVSEHGGSFCVLLRLKYHGISVYTSDHLVTNLEARSTELKLLYE
jgi:hypothetical protein